MKFLKSKLHLNAEFRDYYVIKIQEYAPKSNLIKYLLRSNECFVYHVCELIENRLCSFVKCLHART